MGTVVLLAALALSYQQTPYQLGPYPVVIACRFGTTFHHVNEKSISSVPKRRVIAGKWLLIIGGTPSQSFVDY